MRPQDMRTHFFILYLDAALKINTKLYARKCSLALEGTIYAKAYAAQLPCPVKGYCFLIFYNRQLYAYMKPKVIPSFKFSAMRSHNFIGHR